MFRDDPDALASDFVGLVGIATGLDMGVGHDVNELFDVIEDHHLVVDAELHVGQIAIVRRRRRKILVKPNDIVARVAHRTAQKPR